MTLAEQIDKLGSTALEIKAQRDRYELALREIAGGGYGDDAMRLAKEALRCE